MLKKNNDSRSVLKDQVKKIVKDIEDGIEEDFNKDDTEQSFFIQIEFRRATGTNREVGRISMPQSDKDDIKKHLTFAMDLIASALKKLQ